MIPGHDAHIIASKQSRPQQIHLYFISIMNSQHFEELWKQVMSAKNKLPNPNVLNPEIIVYSSLW